MSFVTCSSYRGSVVKQVSLPCGRYMFFTAGYTNSSTNKFRFYKVLRDFSTAESIGISHIICLPQNEIIIPKLQYEQVFAEMSSLGTTEAHAH